MPLNDPTFSTNSQDIGAPAEGVYIPLYVDKTGMYRRIPSNGILDIAGIYSSNFTIGGRAIMFADGSASDGSGNIDLQTVYQHSDAVAGAARISLAPGKDFAICDAAGNSFIQVDAETGKITINAELAVISSIVKFTGAYQEFDHLNILSNDGLKPALVIEPKNGIQFTTDPVRIRTSYNGPIDFSVNAQGQTYIRELLVDSIDANLIDGVDFSAISAHLSPTAAPFKHFATEIKYEPGFISPALVLSNPVSINVAIDTIVDTFASQINALSAAIDLIIQDESAETSFFQRIIELESDVADLNTSINGQTGLSSRMATAEAEIQHLTSVVNNIHTANIAGINFEQYYEQNVWTINHNTGSRFVQFTVYDNQERFLLPDDAFSLDPNTFVIVFANPQSGRAILSCLVPPVTTLFEETSMPL